jgi:hypothetical protein
MGRYAQARLRGTARDLTVPVPATLVLSFNEPSFSWVATGVLPEVERLLVADAEGGPWNTFVVQDWSGGPSDAWGAELQWLAVIGETNLGVSVTPQSNALQVLP